MKLYEEVKRTSTARSEYFAGLSDLRSTAETTGTNACVSVELSVPGNPPVAADRRILRDILFNLLSNAIKYTPSGGRVRMGNENSMGLGLAFTKLLVEQHGGSIRYESIPGGGSTFRFTLKRASETAKRVRRSETGRKVGV